MAWKLKKSKVEDNGAAVEAPTPSILVSHGHQIDPPEQVGTDVTDESDDFFGSRLDAAEHAMNSLNGARAIPFDDEAVIPEEPIEVRPDSIPTVKSAFVMPDIEPNAPALEQTNFESSPQQVIEPNEIDFGDVEFSVLDEPETVEFGLPTPEPIALAAQTPIAASAPEPMAMPTWDPPAPIDSLPETDDLDKTALNFGVLGSTTARPIAPPTVPVAPVAPTMPITAPKAVLPSKVVVKIGPFHAEHELSGAGSELVIGRPDYNTGESPAISVELDDAISRRHARIILTDDQYKIEDLGSKNGTLINGQPLMPNVPMPFNIGDVVRVGERTELTLI